MPSPCPTTTSTEPSGVSPPRRGATWRTPRRRTPTSAAACTPKWRQPQRSSPRRRPGPRSTSPGWMWDLRCRGAPFGVGRAPLQAHAPAGGPEPSGHAAVGTGGKVPHHHDDVRNVRHRVVRGHPPLQRKEGTQSRRRRRRGLPAGGCKGGAEGPPQDGRGPRWPVITGPGGRQSGGGRVTRRSPLFGFPSMCPGGGGPVPGDHP